MMNGDRTCPSNKPYNDTGSAFNGSCSPRPQVKAERKREALAERRIGQVSPEVRRTRERSTVERVNGRLKDEFGGRYLRVRGPGKVWCHLMFGILALTVEQLMRLML